MIYEAPSFLKILYTFFLTGFVASKECIKFDVTITQEIKNQGFHRDLNWLIETENLDPESWLNASCDVALKFDINRGMFVNPDQADDLKRLGKLDIMVDGSVDIEAPAHEATQHTVYIFLNRTQFLDRIFVKLPIHLRYHRSLMGGHEKVILRKPLLLVHCPISNNIICGKDRKVSAPTSSQEFGTIRVWKNVTYKAHFDEMELLVPVGNLNDYPYVAIISCVLGCAGCVYLLSLMSRNGDEEDNRRVVKVKGL